MFSADGLTSRLTPGARLDDNLDGIPDVALPAGSEAVPVGNGERVQYTLRYENRGNATAQAVQVKAKTWGALRFLTGGDTATFNLGDVPVGKVATLRIETIVNTKLNGKSGELALTLSDAQHGDFDWMWSLHPIDTAAPSGLTLGGPDGYALPGTTSFYGFVNDPAGVTTITLDIDGRLVDCPVTTPASGSWRCDVNLGSLANKDKVSVRARASDTHGNQSAWTAALVLPVDITPPTVQLDARVQEFLADGIIGPSEFEWSGRVVDNREARSLVFCPDNTGALNCTTLDVTPAGSAQGAWQLVLGDLLAGDNITKTLTLDGVDGAGNYADSPLQRTIRVDTVPPVLTAQQSDSTRFTGRVTDGGALRSLRAIIMLPDGSSRVDEIAFKRTPSTSSTWSYQLAETAVGAYKVVVAAEDEAGNSASTATFSVEIQSLPTATSTVVPTASPTTTPTVRPTQVPTTTPTVRPTTEAVRHKLYLPFVRE